MKIGFVGTMSVGKTTLVKELSELPEFQNYKTATERSKYLNSIGIKLNIDSTMKGQSIFLAERTSELFNDNLLTDRTIIDVMSFTNLAKSISHIQADEFENFAANFINEYDYIFYISPKGIEIENNGIRETNPEYRTAIDNEIKKLIKKYSHKIKSFHELSGPTEERIKQIKEVVFS